MDVCSTSTWHRYLHHHMSNMSGIETDWPKDFKFSAALNNSFKP